MPHARFTDFRQNLATHVDGVLQSRAPLLVTRRGKEAVVVMAEGEYESLQETLHLLSNPANAERLRAGIKQLDAGEGIERDPTL